MPAILAVPCVGATNPVKSRIVVVLPAPLGPRNATTSPLGIENVTSRTARNDPNCLLSPSASIMTGFDMLLRSSENSSERKPARITRARSSPGAIQGTTERQTSRRRGASLARHSKARNPRKTHYEVWLNVFIMRRPSRLRNRLRNPIGPARIIKSLMTDACRLSSMHFRSRTTHPVREDVDESRLIHSRRPG